MKLTRLLLPLVALLILPALARAETANPDIPADARTLLDVPYVTAGHARQKLNLYIPAHPAGPLLVWIHGGGWTSGNKDKPAGLPLLAQGFTVASLEYRFSQDAIFPAQIEDCKAALRWLRAHATEYGYDPQRIGAGGDSAGGHLAALIGTTGKMRDFDVGENLGESSAVQCVMDFYGPADFLAYDPTLPTEMVQRENPNSVLAKLFGGPISAKKELAARASPITWVTKDAAPMLILQGTKDPLVPLEQSRRLADKLQAAGAEVTLETIEGAAHGGPEFFSPERVKLMVNFLNRHLLKK